MPIESLSPRASAAPGTHPDAVPSRRGRRLRRRLGTAAFVIACAGIALTAPVPYLTQSLDQIAAAGTGLGAHYAGQPTLFQVALLIHAATGGLALLITPLQGWGRLRHAGPGLHRFTGRLLGGSILIAAATGLVIAQVSYAGVVGTVGFSALSLLWAFSVRRTIRAATRQNRAEHRAWAVRTAALTFAAVTLRLWTGLLIAVQQPDSAVAAQAAFDRIYPLMPFLSWVPNILVAEWFLRRRGSGYAARNKA